MHLMLATMEPPINNRLKLYQQHNINNSLKHLIKLINMRIKISIITCTCSLLRVKYLMSLIITTTIQAIQCLLLPMLLVSECVCVCVLCLLSFAVYYLPVSP